ncbi:hypothetical protein QQS21_000787 [Conoideocrella luteorostrata]|uniref:Major facilitator superfamily (MFS) profile domain-containing protein n=1 Tax=Conoideocrella luteorostrata TaxID=1105319 RepID=A0AAJ0CYK7_9HYPO|nr:hypothetical protein QQS21_000787 [Conoideocrella luteorostrata]
MVVTQITEKSSAEEVKLSQTETLPDDGRESYYNQCISVFTPKEQKKIIRKVDRRLVLTLGLLYAISLMDRNNTGIVMIAGMSVDLVMTGPRYSIVVLLFFVPYVLFQPVATVILRKIGPRTFLAITTLIWGMATIVSGFVKTWAELIPLRLILGICEAGFFPTSAFTGILAFGFSQLEGSGAGPDWWGRVVMTRDANGKTSGSFGPGIAGWRWIFILQGILTCIVALVTYILVLGFPDVADAVCGFRLDKKEAAFMLARIELDRQDASPVKFKLGKYLAGGLDLKIWGFAALFGLTTINTYSLAYFLPLILRDGMGFSVAASQCLIAPPHVAAGITMYTMAYLSDKYHMRSPFIIVNCCLLLIGLPLLGFTKNVGLRYFGAFVTTTACNANVPCILTWQANNIRGQWKRALCSATLVGTGGIGGIIGTTVFRSQDAPGYRPGMYATIAASALMMLVTLLLDLKFIRANKRAASGGKPIGGLKGFRYTL